jgi:tetratricopeptide (TPR) repeat protein
MMNVDMDIDLSKLEVKNRRSVHLVPVLKNGTDSLELSPVGIYSRGRYINYLRRGESIFQDLGETVYKESDKPKVINYAVSVPYMAWMDGSEVVMNRKTCGCCQDLLTEESSLLGGFAIPVYEPYFLYIQPAPELSKTRQLAGSAFIDFVVSRTDIRPDYRNNAKELDNIIATIDSVKNDPDIKVKSFRLKGYASPESPYKNNERLAKGRTESLKKYVQNLYSFTDDVIQTDFEPENWDGLRAYVEASDLEHKAEILEAIDSDLAPDAKEWKIKQTWAADYRILLDNCYPALRKTNYRIEYTIESFTDVDKIVEIFRTAPNKLSLNELYIASTAFESGSEEFAEVFSTAVRMYPKDPVANLNAANAAMERGDFKAARNYLRKAGESPEAIYAMGLYYMGVGEYAEAEKWLTDARKEGIIEANEMLSQCAKLKEYYTNNY